MLTTSITSLRRMLGFTLTVLLAGSAFSLGAQAPASSAPAVIGSSATMVTLTSAETTGSSSGGFGGTQEPAVDNYGNLVFTDYPNDGLFEIPVGTTNVITLVPEGGLTTGGTYAEPSVAFDSNNNMFIPGNYGNCMLLFPWDATTQTWNGLSALSTTNAGSLQCPVEGSPSAWTNPPDPQDSFVEFGETPSYFQPWGLAVLPGSSPAIAFGSQISPDPIYILPFIYTGNSISSSACQSNGNCSPVASPSTATTLVTSLSARAPTMASDQYGNLYFTEDTSSNGLPGAYMISAANIQSVMSSGTSIPSDGSSEVVRIDPKLPKITGVSTDASGNVYISDSTEGIFVVPADPTTGAPNTAGTYLLTSLPAYSAAAVDSHRGLLYVETVVNSTNVMAIVSLHGQEFGSTPIATPTTAQSVYFAFDQAETPANFVVQEAGVATPDFTIGTGGTCAGGTAQAASTGCTVNVVFNPSHTGDVSANLVALDASGNVLASLDLHGTGTGAMVNVLQGGETPIDAGLKTPAQVAVDAAGNTYVADSGLDEVLMFAAGSTTGTAIGSGWKQPTGVAVDGAGDLFVADSGDGTVVEIPVGPSGLNTAGQITLKSGLGTSLNLASDDAGHLYVADPINKQVVELTNPAAGTGAAAEIDLNTASGYSFNAPSAVATDSSEDLYVADGTNLTEVTPSGTQTTIPNSVNNATGMVVDPSGSIYVAEFPSVERIPNVSGTLTPSLEVPVAVDVTGPTSVALDLSENLYIADATNGDVDAVSTSASTNFGTQSTPTSAITPVTYTVLNSGNTGLTVTGFSSTPDYSVTNTNCTGGTTAFAPGASCTATVTFSPGPGDSGTLPGFVQVQGNEVNQPVGVQATGVGAALAGSATAIAINNPTVDSVSVVVTVTPTTAGTTPAPTGSVTLTIGGGSLTSPTVVNGTLSAGTSGSATVTLTPGQLPAGSYTFAVSYQGDRVYSGSNASASVALAASPIILTQPTLAQAEAQDGTYLAEPGATLNSDGSCCATYGSAYVNGVLYVLSTSTTGSLEAYDGTAANITYSYPMTVATTNGAPLIGVPVVVGGLQTATNYGTVTFAITGPTSTDTTAAQEGCSAVAVGADGTANFLTDCLPIDTSNTAIPDYATSFTVTPSYSPEYLSAGYTNTNYSAVAGTSFTVTALAHPMVVITPANASLSVAKGSSASTTLTLTSLLGYGYTGATGNQHNWALPVDLQCDGLPAYATCSFSYPAAPAVSQWDPNPDPNAAYVTPIGTPTPDGESVGPAQVVMTITTNIPAGVEASLMHRSGGTELATVFGLSLLGLAFGKKRSLRGRLMVMLFVLLTSGIVAGSTGCSTSQFGISQAATPAGTFQVLVTARQTGSAYIEADAASGDPWVYGNANQVSLPYTVNVTVQ